MKLFVVLSRFPYPLEKGDKLRAYYQLKELAKSHQIYLNCLTDQTVKDEWVKEIESFCEKVTIYPLSKVLIYWNTAKQVFTNKPFQIGYFYQNKIQKRIHKEINDIQPDHIYCQLIRTAEYVKDIHNVPKTIDYMDALSKGMLRRSEIKKGLKAKLYKIEGKRLSEYENRIFDYFNHHTIISKQDRDLISHPEKEKIEIIENGISDDFFNYSSKSEKSHDLVFIGNMNYPPNIECSEFIGEQLSPELSELKFMISGASPHQKIIDLKKIENITVTGWVDDIKESYASGKIFLAPLFIGTGLQNKLLEAMAMGLPVITTPLANNALNAKPNEQILIASTKEEFVEHINALLSNQDLYCKISKAGQAHVKSRFSWTQSVQKLELLMS
ncbi:MAG: sugar transferase (PEP-CTERM/EpsH1 system associated) [Arenicella sp.]|jgi:sugar transferase (PEP-CTERM/EpsH1 system associated)